MKAEEAPGLNDNFDTLALQIANGNKFAEAEFAKRIRPVLSLIFSRGKISRDGIDDLIQETIEGVLKRARLQQITHLSGYTHAFAKNLLVSFYRNLEKTEHTYPHESSDPAELLEKQEMGRLAVAVLSELPSVRDREVLLRHYVQAQDKSVVCSDLQISPDQFDRVIHRARMRLKEVLDQRTRTALALVTK